MNLALQTRADYARCSGCGICLLVCPVWRETRDIALTPLARAKALQQGAAVDELAESIASCTLCGACAPACPEQIDLVAMSIDLRRRTAREAVSEFGRRASQIHARGAGQGAESLLLAGALLRALPATLAHACARLGNGAVVAEDDGSDIALALETGQALSQERLTQFLRPLRGAKRLVVADGLLTYQLRRWLPRADIVGLGERLSGLACVRSALRVSDLYAIEPRAYHADFERLVKHYDALRAECGCSFNLDLQRIAIPASALSLPRRLKGEAESGGQVCWILQGRSPARIVVECAAELEIYRRATSLPVVHLADLAQDKSL